MQKLKVEQQPPGDCIRLTVGHHVPIIIQLHSQRINECTEITHFDTTELSIQKNKIH